jgi:hypothetical protein
MPGALNTALGVGDTVNILICPSQTKTTATVVSVDNFRRQCVVTHVTGAVSGQTSTMHQDHVREVADLQAPVTDNKTWK